MAELNVQPKKKTSIIPWILLLLGVIALIWGLTRNKTDNNVAATNTTTVDSGRNQSVSNNTANGDWGAVNFDAPEVNYNEITNKDVTVRGNDAYGIYSLGENVLFDEGKATIRPDAEANLKQVVSSIGQHYKGGDVRVYGFTDASGSASSNKELAQQRADAVKAWLQSNGIDAGHISENAIGEAQPVATNSTEQGRQQNRRVQIVARATK